MPTADEQNPILDRIRAIPAGFVRTYGDVSPHAPREPGRLLKTVHASDIPWWRLVRANGSLAAGESQLQRLRDEGVPFVAARPGARPRVDLAIARLPEGGA